MTSLGHRIRQRYTAKLPGEKTQALSDSASLSDRPAATRLSMLQLEVAHYIEDIASELRNMAKSADLQALSYFLEMARIEASIQVEKHTLSLAE